MEQNNNNKNAAKIEDYYVPKDIALAKSAYLDTYDKRNRNFILSIPLGLASSLLP